VTNPFGWLVVSSYFMISNIAWDPTTYDKDISSVIACYDASIDIVHCSNFDDNGIYRYCTVKLILYMQHLSIFMQMITPTSQVYLMII
jgi:hypothetical protein